MLPTPFASPARAAISSTNTDSKCDGVSGGVASGTTNRNNAGHCEFVQATGPVRAGTVPMVGEGAGIAGVASVMRKVPSITVRLEGHTDSPASLADNLRLSRNRVEMVFVDSGGHDIHAEDQEEDLQLKGATPSGHGAAPARRPTSHR